MGQGHRQGDIGRIQERDTANFCVPVTGGDDADAKGPKLRKHVIEKEPVQGWQAWSEDIVEMIGYCETAEALDRLRSRQAALLTAISRERADLYARLGAAFVKRVQQLAQPSPATAKLEDGVRIADAVAAISTETVDA